MKIVTDAAANLPAEKAARFGVEVVPFQITFLGKTYRDGVDITPDQLYRLYTDHPNEFPITSQPSAGDFVQVYERYNEEDILSVHLSSGLSGTYLSAEAAAHLVSNERVTVVDSKTVGPALGWMVEIAAHGVKLGWSKDRILEAMKQMKENSITMVSFSDLKYLIHSGRVSHLQSIMASLLRIKPIIGMNDTDGRYSSLGQELTMSKVVRKMTDLVMAKVGNQKIRLQLMHGNNLQGVDILRTGITRIFDCVEEALVPVTPVLGAHAGPTVIGLAAMPMQVSDALLR